MNKLTYLELILSSNIYDIVCLVETFLKKNDSDSLLLYGNLNYTIFRYDRNSHSGGVAIICKKYLYFLILSKLPYICNHLKLN